MATTESEFLMVFRESTPEVYEAMSRDEREQALERWNAWCQSLVDEGRLQQGNTLAPAGRSISRAAGTRALDGPFAEAKELIGGYILLHAGSLDEATAIAEQCPNLPYGAVVEVRPVAQACHLARSLGWTTMTGPA